MLISVVCAYILSPLMPQLSHISHRECHHSPEAHRSFRHTQRHRLGVLNSQRRITFFSKFTQTQQLKRCVIVCTPVWEWISRAIRQFQESPATAQFSCLTCRLRGNVQHYSVRFFNLFFSSMFYTPTVCHMFLSLHS